MQILANSIVYATCLTTRQKMNYDIGASAEATTRFSHDLRGAPDKEINILFFTFSSHPNIPSQASL